MKVSKVLTTFFFFLQLSSRDNPQFHMHSRAFHKSGQEESSDDDGQTLGGISSAGMQANYLFLNFEFPLANLIFAMMNRF
jgi:hypothetical protein